ncbi:MAG: hypothetical protein VXY53_03165 [Candidatus Thermoplasmatota archaeon]|nr:hypothetical protein [Candidatus Thermoplasmatota archaeon]
MVLSALPGVGERLAKKMTDHFGSEEAVLSSLKSGDIGQIAEIDGVSPKRALALARSIAGDDGQFLATKESVKLHQQLINQIANFTASPVTKSRLQLLTPISDAEPRRAKIQSAMEFLLRQEKLANEISTHLKSVNTLKANMERYERVVVTQDGMEDLKKYCRVLNPSASETWKDYTVFNKVTWLGKAAPSVTPEGWIVLGSNPPKELVVPEMTLDWFKKNRQTLSALCEIITVVGSDEGNNEFVAMISAGVEGLEQLPELLHSLLEEGDTERAEVVKDQLWSYCKELENQVNNEVEKAMNDAKLALSGAELLDALADGSGFQRRLKEATGHVIDNAMQHAVNKLSEFMDGCGIRCPPVIFTSEWPAKIDRQVIEKVDENLEKRISSQKSNHIYNMAKKLGPLKVKCESAVRSLISNDQWLTIARWAKNYSCVMPKMVNHGIWVKNGRHILLGIEPDPVTYGLGKAASSNDQQSLALLTGANSGGKTTLLELLAHTCILAHMGLPVPASDARVGKVDALHILAKAGGTQSAGALEQTLLELASVVSDPTPKLILADELEAITEPGAGARIIAGMLLAARAQKDTSMMLVTHLAPAIIEASGVDDFRVDGIEARGLDSELELIVDRTPIRNHLARSTPELIVKRLVERSSGNAKSLFDDILQMF